MLGRLVSTMSRAACCFFCGPLLNALNHFCSYKVAERMHTDSVLVVLVSDYVTEVDWSLTGVSNDSVLHDFTTDTGQGYPAEKIGPVKPQKVHDGPVVLVMVSVVDLN